MTASRWRLVLVGAGVVATIAIGFVWSQLPSIGANMLLHPPRHVGVGIPPHTCESTTFTGEGLHLEGWRCHPPGEIRGTLVYLHGIGDNRWSGAGIIQRFGARGFDVVVYDERAHGQSDGDACTYGFFEKLDLHRVLDTIRGPIVLLGHSLGGAIALQEAADDPRVTTVVAAETFSDLRTVSTERAPFFFTAGVIDRGFRLAEREARFQVDAVSPVKAAARITIPVLVIHGEADTDTPPSHSRRVFDALAGSKRLILVPGARHNESLRGGVWDEVDRWIDDAISTATDYHESSPAK
jgi:alpha-beta hydrolase superfamily lysophospholipase